MGETIVLKARINLRDFAGNGYEGLHQQLSVAAQQGYGLGAVIDEATPKPWSYDRTVELICQRSQGETLAQRQYVAVHVPMHVQWNCGHVRAGLPTLLQTLEHHGSSGHRVASIYNPSFAGSFGGGYYECHVIFEKTNVNYQMSVVECAVKVCTYAGHQFGTMDHREYYQVISAWSQQGWELAALVDMPDRWNEGCCRAYGATVVLVFQHPCPP